MTSNIKDFFSLGASIGLASGHTKDVSLLLSSFGVDFADGICLFNDISLVDSVSLANSIGLANNDGLINNISLDDTVSFMSNVLSIIGLKTTSLEKCETTGLEIRKSAINIMIQIALVGSQNCCSSKVN